MMIYVIYFIVYTRWVFCWLQDFNRFNVIPCAVQRICQIVGFKCLCVCIFCTSEGFQFEGLFEEECSRAEMDPNKQLIK